MKPNEEKKDSTVSSGLKMGALAGIAAIGATAAYEYVHQETKDEAPETTIQISLEERSKQSIMNEIIKDDTRVKLLEALVKDGAPQELLEDENENGEQATEFSKVMLKDFLHSYREAGTTPDHAVIQAEIDRLKARMTEFRARRDILDAIETAEKASR